MPVMPVPGLDYMGIPNQAHGPTAMKWDPKNLEIRTTSVERTLEPLVIQVALHFKSLWMCRGESLGRAASFLFLWHDVFITKLLYKLHA
jgi:hypothetical protein